MIGWSFYIALQMVFNIIQCKNGHMVKVARAYPPLETGRIDKKYGGLIVQLGPSPSPNPKPKPWFWTKANTKVTFNTTTHPPPTQTNFWETSR